MASLNVRLYSKEFEEAWNDFVSKSKNGTFLFHRRYMEYHADRFKDFSLLLFEEEKLVAIFPANIAEDVAVSHGGLTFGGVIYGTHMKVHRMLIAFDGIIKFLKENKVRKLIYKTIPYIYHSLPSQEDLYALFIHGAVLTRRDIASTIRLPNRVPISKGRKACIAKGRRVDLQIQKSYDFDTFMNIEEDHLKKKHNASPVHTSSEIRYLAELFPDNIKLFAACQGSAMLGGVIVYESQNVAHAQYIAATEEGKKMGALDLVIDYLINQYYQVENPKEYFDFGISTTQQGRLLDQNLIANKESFGARAISYDFYELTF